MTQQNGENNNKKVVYIPKKSPKAATFMMQNGNMQIRSKSKNNKKSGGKNYTRKPIVTNYQSLATNKYHPTAKIDAGKLKIIPLGGLGKIGRNMMAIEYEEDVIIIDCGTQFADERTPGVGHILPNIEYLEARKDRIKAYLITHAHEDHVGGLPFILPKLPAPIVSAKFSIEFIKKKFSEYRFNTQPLFKEVNPDTHERLRIGNFIIEFVRVVHSIPDACMVVIDTPVGKIINTGDWRFDEHTYLGNDADKKRIKEIGDQGVLLLMSDSTSCDIVGRSTNELEVHTNIEQLLNRLNHRRIFISLFSSQINRIQMVADIAAKTGRKIALLGRSIVNNVEMSLELGYLRFDPGLIVKAKNLDDPKLGNLIVICTGSQGEENAVLMRMSTGDHPQAKLHEKDVVVLSSSMVPGNEGKIWEMIDHLFFSGVKVYVDSLRNFDNFGCIHGGGHGHQDEIIEMIGLVRPKYFLPIHGGGHHLFHNAENAYKAGMSPNNVFVVENGQTLVAQSINGETIIKKGEKVPAGIVYLDSNNQFVISKEMLSERQLLARNGVILVSLTFAKNGGQLLARPLIQSKGFYKLDTKDNLRGELEELIIAITKKRDRSLSANSMSNLQKITNEVQSKLNQVYSTSPIVMVNIMLV